MEAGQKRIIDNRSTASNGSSNRLISRSSRTWWRVSEKNYEKLKIKGGFPFCRYVILFTSPYCTFDRKIKEKVPVLMKTHLFYFCPETFAPPVISVLLSLHLWQKFIMQRIALQPNRVLFIWTSVVVVTTHAEASNLSYLTRCLLNYALLQMCLFHTRCELI